MNIVWGIGEAAVTWAFPQVGAAVEGAKNVKKVYNAAKLGTCVATGDFSGVLSQLSNKAFSETCDTTKKYCNLACLIFLFAPGMMETCSATCYGSWLACKGISEIV